jgi:TPR repeat protein
MLATTVSLMLLIFAVELAAEANPRSQSQLTRPQPPQLINAATTRQRYAFIGSWPTQATLLRRMRLGRCTSMAQACRRIFSEALKWFRLAADQGLDGAQYNLGLLLQEHRLPLFVAKAGKIPSV